MYGQLLGEPTPGGALVSAAAAAAAA